MCDLQDFIANSLPAYARGVKVPTHFTTDFGDYEVSDVLYEGRQARVLYSGERAAAQSGIPLDGKDTMLFDYNERFMELVRGLKPASILLIGGGAYTLPAAILKHDRDVQLDIVEPDAGLEVVGKRYFGYEPTDRTQSHTMGGAAYLAGCRRAYDLILVDAFVHDRVPVEFQTAETAEQLRRVLKPQGLLAMNVITASRGRRAVLMERLRETFAATFGMVEFFPAGHGISEWIPQNYLLCAGVGHPEEFLRYPALEAEAPFWQAFDS